MSEVLVLTPSFGQHSPEPWAVLDAGGVTVRRPRAPHPQSSAQLAEEVGDAEALIVGLDDVDAAAIAAGPRLKVIAKHGVGVDNIDLAAAGARGIVVVNAPGSNSGAVADLVMGMLLASARQLVPAHESVVAGRWERFFGPELQGATLGIVGFGRIGQEVARRAHGFSMDVCATDPFVPEDVMHRAGVRPVSLETAFAEARFLTLHLPGGERVVTAERLATMAPGAYLVNAARGDLVDEQAVADALHDGRLAGYAADAFAEEPPTGSPLLTAPRTLLTPHVGAFTDRANQVMGTTVAHDVLRVLRGEAPAHPVNG